MVNFQIFSSTKKYTLRSKLLCPYQGSQLPTPEEIMLPVLLHISLETFYDFLLYSPNWGNLEKLEYVFERARQKLYFHRCTFCNCTVIMGPQRRWQPKSCVSWVGGVGPILWSHQVTSRSYLCVAMNYSENYFCSHIQRKIPWLSFLVRHFFTQDKELFHLVLENRCKQVKKQSCR